MLYNYFLTNTHRPMIKWVHYFPIYERHFKKFINQSVNFWEIGVFKGGSLEMWKRYLGPFARIVGIDIDPECKRYEEEQINICIGDQSDTDFLQSVIDKHGPPDIVLDDGSHIMKHICASFDFLYNKLTKNGIYMVEDLHCAYWDSYGGGLKRKGTFIEHCKNMIDSLNARHWGGDSLFADSTYSMSFYDSIAVFEKMEWAKDSLKLLLIPDTRELVACRKHNDKKISVSKIEGKKIMFGSGVFGTMAGTTLKSCGFNVDYYVDNDKTKQGKFINDIEIISPEKSLAVHNGNYIITVKSRYASNDIFNQLKNMGIADENIYYNVDVIWKNEQNAN